MKTSMKFWLIVAMVLFGATLMISGNAGAVIVTPQPGVVVIGAPPAVTPVFGSGFAPGLVAPRPVLSQPFFPFFRPFFPFANPFINPFVDVDINPFIGVGVNPGFVD